MIMAIPFICTLFGSIYLYSIYLDINTDPKPGYMELIDSVDESQSIEGMKAVSKFLIYRHIDDIGEFRELLKIIITVLLILAFLNIVSMFYIAKKVKMISNNSLHTDARNSSRP